jgi:hypothetical protein
MNTKALLSRAVNTELRQDDVSRSARNHERYIRRKED